MNENSISHELSQLKEKALAASRSNDRDFYASYLAGDAVAIMPAGVFSKDQVLSSMTGAKAPFSAKRIEDTKISVLNNDVGLVTYRAIYDRDGHEQAVMTTTVYQRSAEGWKGVLYQQTPLG